MIRVPGGICSRLVFNIFAKDCHFEEESVQMVAVTQPWLGTPGSCGCRKPSCRVQVGSDTLGSCVREESRLPVGNVQAQPPRDHWGSPEPLGPLHRQARVRGPFCLSFQTVGILGDTAVRAPHPQLRQVPLPALTLALQCCHPAPCSRL